MHIFSCQPQDEVHIGQTTRLTILEVADDHVRIAIRTLGDNPEYQEHIIYPSGCASSLNETSSSNESQLVEI